MPTITYSRKSRWWRPLCTNRLAAEPVSTGSEPVARPCSVCVQPMQMPPRYGCWCTNLTRPGGVDSSLTLTLGGSFGADSASGTFLSNTGSVTINSPAGSVIAGMSPADGVKSTTYTNSSSREWVSATGTSFVAKNLSVYQPQNSRNPDGCWWLALAGFKYFERVYHPTIIRTEPHQTYTYNIGFGVQTGKFHKVSIARAHEVVTRDITLDNNDPASIWIATYRTNFRYSKSLFRSLVTSWVPAIANGMPFEAGGTPCAPVPCNPSCYPVRGFCHYPTGQLDQTDGVQKTRYAYWDWFPDLFGYYWIVKRYSAGVWMAWLIGRASAQFTTAIYTKPRCNTTGGGINPYNAYYAETGGSGTAYPVSYHNAQPTWTLPGGSLFGYGTGGFLSAEGSASFGGGMTGTARHPSWSGSIPTLNLSTMAPVFPLLEPQDTPLAVYATEDLPCNHSGTASMLKIADYRTAPNAAASTIYAGPTSFPSSASLQF